MIDPMETFREVLVSGAAALGLEMNDMLADAVSSHFTLVSKWSKKMNLTAILDPTEAAHRHGLDSLLLTLLIPPDVEEQVVDVGSGAGYPGIVVALARPKLQVTLLEPIRKRASFLRVALAELGLDQVRVVEDRLTPLHRARYPTDCFPTDLMLSRATIPPVDLIPLARPHLRTGGRLILMAGSGVLPLDLIRETGLKHGLLHLDRHTHRLTSGESRILDVLKREG